jgi:hypothetical protein
MPRILPDLLAEGNIEPNRVRLLDNRQKSLKDRVQEGMELLRENRVSGEKVVVKIDPIRAEEGSI